mmetsp:Transcript_20620/g.44879  ORF Transcript_20620/g.44879 Transcript_20620/m.44879 type:complete len:239 (-) Transcript_20620:3353-4069(-)|eukprot:CAMPEP_0168224142 /NCGR_PEP_ID=MMETSP0140_2-20121125/11846_1 /TAXON_ID=44445 /ORGANISM="Pseudo-nitzschia australis, Strain 10249 10 AB" /LENGTH=238 /DNA_ID=CAMNT_0008154391 /DNA_START=148 /DNA_END=864 /DNA_ORIENTATION=+
MSSSSPPPSSASYYNDGKSSIGKRLSLVEAMEAADRIRKFLRERKDPVETEQWFPPGTWQGATAFAATGLLMTPLRGSILNMAGPRGPFQGFIDLVVTPVLAVGAFQVGLVIGTLYGSSYYLERVAKDAATTTTMTFYNDGTNEAMAVRRGQDDALIYRPMTEGIAAEREQTVAQLCQQVLSLLPSSTSSLEESAQTPSFQQIPTDESSTFTFASWDPRTKTMENLTLAVDNCRRREH